MSTSFTPGPWWIDDRRPDGALQIQAQHRGEGSSYCVATVNDWEWPDANARLIAASPEMYEALRKARELIVLVAQATERPDIVQTKTMASIDAAIAKATGDERRAA